MPIDTNLFEAVCQTPGTSGFEHRIRNLILDEVRDVVDSYDIDNMGNLIAYRKGTGDKRVMAAAHMDEIGFLVKHIDDNGFIRFQTVGGFDPKTLTAQKVIVHGTEDLVGVMGTKPIHVMTEEERKQLPKAKDYFIDLGLNKEEVEQYVSLGDPVTRKGEFLTLGNHLSCKSLDNRASVYALIHALRDLKNASLPYDFYAVFSVQEEVGLRGAASAAHQLDPDFGIALDTTIAFDTPGASPQDQITKIGDGTAIKVMDAATICDQRMVRYLKKTAGDAGLAYQMEVLSGGATDTAMLQRMGKQGAIAGAISLPIRNMHQVIELINKEDLSASVELLKAAVKDLDQFDWNHL